jgi:hypothetical protein
MQTNSISCVYLFYLPIYAKIYQTSLSFSIPYQNPVSIFCYPIHALCFGSVIIPHLITPIELYVLLSCTLLRLYVAYWETRYLGIVISLQHGLPRNLGSNPRQGT